MYVDKSKERTDRSWVISVEFKAANLYTIQIHRDNHSTMADIANADNRMQTGPLMQVRHSWVKNKC